MAADFAASVILDTALSVSGLTDYLRLLLEHDEQLRQVWVVGEVSSTNHHRSGLFFTLQDPDGSAAIKCVVWSSQVPKLAQLPVAGEQLIVLGSIRLYPQRGEYQLSVWQAVPAGVGLQALRYQQLKNRLLAEGLFDPQRKRSLPIHPQTIAVVTSPTAAAWGDIQKTLKHRYPGLHVLFSPATVQGEQAPESIVKAIARVEKDGRAEVLILSRGGGAVEELACFNDERVVRAVAECSIPVVTGIGHQRDESLVDLVADVCVHTPTAAAEKVVPSLAELSNQHRQRIIALHQVLLHTQTSAENQLQTLRNRLQNLRLDRHLQQEAQKLNWQRQRLLQLTMGRSQQAKQHLELLRQKLISLDPKSVLQRGYAVVRQENGAIARSADELAVGNELFIQLAQGEVKAKVIEVEQRQ
ncbi:exodeoxyribonuclease VII large subunit [Anabaena sp. FACHB-709]|uniref:Exodeoxyribonuclease 7 large subunit n=3 Tax=Nostocaceae TaxID=1162 RepID=EX7L_NOSS1|nr:MULTISPECIES: exodeoxyribonuclease VII large subunit [Nostocaceae]Q8YW42.1 RecName: Full=Exodeoxyribonuclease 7 large subunit; AltName: Full=Exodeoxyribonuclease VII large subunit; Short=Exonuclease VII large subunit [Nostoc sp. PCC 7120 = FACHB-418]BAY67392.1 exodeoxyribonuclease VII large subunit [Trichormus variabilis NIES-23]HBW30878.1 exodeoxyribonuclease VII large subunit [Nostoc sp. UBA8866]MBD2173334.1 exodeoxyribonuclease VII large subunit [Anabaena cylindrica FACHB-318]MBD2265085.